MEMGKYLKLNKVSNLLDKEGFMHAKFMLKLLAY